jgi:hypothetical protein
MDRFKKSDKKSMSKKNGNPYNDMDGIMPMKNSSGKKKDKNWKNHLLDNVEEGIDISSLENLDSFKDFTDEKDEEDL